MVITRTTFCGTVYDKVYTYVQANPGCVAADIAKAVGSTEGSVCVMLCRMRERVWNSKRLILTYQTPNGLRFKKEGEE